MSDKAHKMTDEMIEELEKKITKTYNQAYKETSEKLNKYLKEFQVKDEAQRALVDAGKLSQDDYEKWRYGQILTGKRWKDLNETIAEDLMRADSKSRSIIGDHMPDAYALNRNYAVYSIEKDAQIDTSYTLYNRRAVENILKDDPNLLPYPKTESPTAKKLRERIDLQWNRQHVNNAVTQGIIQGEPIDKVAKRLMNVVNMDGRAALRNARTMMTGAQNKGRQDGFDELKEKGVDLRERWIATLDDRTRHSHRLLHGEYKDPDTGKYSNGLEYPGDPFGEPEEVYNCRCTELAEVAGFPLDIPTWSPDMGDMTFEEWLGEHEDAVSVADNGYSFGNFVSDFTPANTREEAEKYADQFVSSYKSKYSGNVSYKGMDVEYANASNKVLTEVYSRYNIDPLGNITPMNKREARFKNSTADAAYQWGGSGGNLFFNTSFYKNSKSLDAHIDDGNSLLQTVLNNADSLLSKDMSQSKRDYIEALIESGCATVTQKVPREEFATCTFVHECGHMLDDKLFGQIIKENDFDVGESMKNYAKYISGYATSNRQEYIAESFASYWYGYDIDPELAKIFKKAEKNGK